MLRNKAESIQMWGWVQSNYDVIKRVFDVVVASCALILLSPVFLIVALVVKLCSKGPVLFWSERVGLNNTVFRMPKFRTMCTSSKVMSREIANSDDIKITAVGHFLRKTSLDELPQLWSILIGDMSLVGPRPLITNDYAAAGRREQPVIYTVKPGLTGLAQVNGRSFISKRNKVRYDSFYAQRRCLILDMKIIYRTFGAVFNTKLVK